MSFNPQLGIQVLREEINAQNADVTTAAVAASVTTLTAFATLTNGSTTARKIRPDSPMILFVSGATQVAQGLIGFSLQSPDGFRSRLITFFGASEFDTVSNQRSALFKKLFLNTLIAAPNYKTLLQVQNNDVATTTAATVFSIADFKSLNVPFDLFARSFPGWLI
jgi:hypothetical protein